MLRLLFFIITVSFVVPTVAEELQPGDFGYKHGEDHAAYQEYFRRIQEDAFKRLKSVADRLQPGDDGYQKEDGTGLAEAYQKVFDSGKCNCSTGECRPTDFRPTPVSKNNPHGVEVKVNRVWCKPSSDTVFLELRDIPDALKKDPAHVCAYGTVDPVTHCPHLECVRINNSY